jgi:cellulose synthase/poly-beta-1,6-N-acetylglucosamine synthase-like glycosyltransferase/peptidoglycan/xylan/chitin deacetylase (PgdA/CDA1 family)/spore germination protein YaaH
VDNEPSHTDNTAAPDNPTPVEPLAPSTAQKPPAAPDPATPPEPAYPVFYDSDRRRWPWVRRGLITGLFLILGGAALLVISLIALPLMPRNVLPKAPTIHDFGHLDPALDDHDRRSMAFKQAQEEKKRQELEAKDRRERIDRRRKDAERRATLPIGPQSPIIAGFYVNWEQTSNASLHRNITAITHLIPEWLHLKAPGADYANPGAMPFLDARQKQDRDDVTPLARDHKVPVLPLFNNFTRKSTEEEGRGDFDTIALHQVVSNPKARVNVIRHLRDWLLREHYQGVNIDFEEVADADRDNLVQFMRELYADFHPRGLLVTQDVQLDNDTFDVAKLAKYNDWLVPMFYDQHAGGTAPGPVAGIDWTEDNLRRFLNLVPRDKVVMGIGNQGYDWRIGDPQNGADSTTYQSAVIIARESQPDAVIQIDRDSLNPTFHYSDTRADADGKPVEEKHVVWMQDALSVFNQLQIGKARGVRGGALWFMGAEDPSLWSFFRGESWNTDWGKIVAAGGLDLIQYKGQGEIDFEGDGELLQPQAGPTDGERDVVRSPKTGLLISETYRKNADGSPKLPSGWVVRRYGGGRDGNADKKIVLTFDDGPDPTWTPQVLDILKKYNVPGTFFVVGKQAEENPELIRRMWNEGHEIGNHSWDHPDMYKLSDAHQHLELTLTQRVIQAITGHSTTLFRPPYGGDVEPRTGKEVSPMLVAAGMNYVTVGEKNDPQDWRLFDLKPGIGPEAQDPGKPRDYREIVESVVDNRDVGSIVLLHDAGGDPPDRSKTIRALPEIITKLREMGYTFTTIADISHTPKAKLMPSVTGSDVYLVGADRYVFEVSYLVQRTLTTLFTLSIVLGVSRVLIFVLLALIQRVREQRRVFPAGFTPSVSVVIAAYNEEKVIARTVRSLLECGYPRLQVIVVDDGSKDATFAVASEAFAGDPRVCIVHKENGGKATALNRGLEEATGEILISLDADTLFAPDTVSKLVRHFADPKVGAVSGNVRVGNTHNIWTRWQALEYITSQNFDRRGYDLLNCITVVPGAVGALRRDAVMQVGGYTHDTLAEDTDLTWKLRRAGWRIANESDAMAYTEAPETMKNLAKQRFRWAFGTLQCLWKHQDALGQHGAFGWIALPSLWLFQILFPAVSPFMDVAMVYSLFTGRFVQFGIYFLAMFLLEFVGAVIAIRMDRANWRLLPWLFFQRFVYRQLMYYVVLKSIVSAARGGAVGWNKFERTGTARIDKKPA